MQDIIRTKRNGGALDEDQVARLTRAMADGTLPREQAGAIAMAIYLNGMDAAETALLTRAMAASGRTMRWQGLPGPVLDKHSTGGIGDKVSLMLAPIVAACGGYVPMVAGRGLGHTGGTIDKLSAIPGYDAFAAPDRLDRAVREVGCAIVGQTDDIAPADRMFYAVRDATQTVACTPLIVASILSKKLAAGLAALVLDVKLGTGAFMATPGQAGALAEAMIAAGAEMGLPTRALLTDMNQPLGRAAGNALEVAEAIAWLRDEAPEPRLSAVVHALAGEMLALGGLAADPGDGARRSRAAVASGAAAERFGRMVAAMGGPADLIERPDCLAAAPVVREVRAEATGTLAAIDGRAVGEALIALGGGRRAMDDAVDPAVGFSAILPLGAAVTADTPLALIHARDEAAAEAGAAAYRPACRIGAGGEVGEVVMARLG